MRLAVQRLGPDLGYLPDGETGVRRNWVIGMIEGFRIEVPVESVVLARAPSALRPALAGLLARRITALAQGAPAGSQFGLHLCLGDMNHRALGRLPDASPLVLLANAVASRWPAGRPLRYVHAPLAAADDPPPASRAFYRPLAGLKLGHGVRFVAGFAHEDQDAAVQFRIREMIEDAVGHPVDVSTQPRPARARCRPGRDGPDQAPARRPRGRMTRPSPGHDHFRAGVDFRKQARVLPVRPSAVARRRPGQLEALPLRARPRGGRTRPRHGPRLGVLPHLP